MLYLNHSVILFVLFVMATILVLLFNQRHFVQLSIVPCEILQSTTDIIVNLTSTVMGSIATYQCRNGFYDVYTTQCTSDGVWEPNPNSTLDCTPPGITTGLMLTSSQASCAFQCV